MGGKGGIVFIYCDSGECRTKVNVKVRERGFRSRLKEMIISITYTTAVFSFSDKSFTHGDE